MATAVRTKLEKFVVLEEKNMELERVNKELIKILQFTQQNLSKSIEIALTGKPLRQSKK